MQPAVVRLAADQRLDLMLSTDSHVCPAAERTSSGGGGELEVRRPEIAVALDGRLARKDPGR